MEKNYILKLYVAGFAPDNQTLIVNFKDHLNQIIGKNYSLEVIDVLEQPQLAEESQILATPTIVRNSPEPVRKIILNPNTQSLTALGLDAILCD